MFIFAPSKFNKSVRATRKKIGAEVMAKTYFVYQCFMSGAEKLYKSGMTDVEATKAWSELDRLIESGCCGDGCAVVGDLNEPSDKWVAQRLGLVA